MGAAELALLASCGISSFEIYQRPKIGILSSGDELVDPSENELREGQIYDSNGIMLVELFRTCGYEVWNGGIVKDRLVFLLR